MVYAGRIMLRGKLCECSFLRSVEELRSAVESMKNFIEQFVEGCTFCGVAYALES